MRRPALKISERHRDDCDDRAAMSDALTRLYRAATQNVAEIVDRLSPGERARLAVFCYGRTHLNAAGLAIAATCKLEHLVAASYSATLGRALFAQSRDISASAKPAVGRRPAITLAGSASSQVSAHAVPVPPELTA